MPPMSEPAMSVKLTQTIIWGRNPNQMNLGQRLCVGAVGGSLS